VAVLAYRIRGMPHFLLVLLDIIATLYFGVAGTSRGLAHGLSPENAALAGTFTALCGGILFTLLLLGRENTSLRQET
jgi:uncharacterized membrane protein YeiH